MADPPRKVTPNFALGGNAGIESVTVLANELNRLVKATRNCKPDSRAIGAAFQRYQEQCPGRMWWVSFLSAFVTRLQAWDGLLMYVMMRWLVPLVVGDERIAQQLGMLVRGSPKLDYVDIEPRRGTIGWKDDKLRKGTKWSKDVSLCVKRLLVFLAGCMIVVVCSLAASSSGMLAS